MATLIRLSRVLLDGELHIHGDFCWCDSHYNEELEMFLHPVASDKGKNVAYSRDTAH